MGSFYAPVNIRHTGAVTAGDFVWAMRVPVQNSDNNPRKMLYIREINLILSDDDNAAVATYTAAQIGYDLIRYRAADPTTGAFPARINLRRPVIANLLASGSIIADANIQQKITALTITNVVQDAGPFAVFGKENNNQGTEKLFMKWGPKEFPLQPDDGIAIRPAFATVAGQALIGFFSWDEESAP